MDFDREDMHLKCFAILKTVILEVILEAVMAYRVIQAFAFVRQRSKRKKNFFFTL